MIKRLLAAGAGLALAAAAQAQVNDECGNALVVLNDSVTAFDTSAASTDGTSSCGFGTALDLWYSFTSTADGQVTVSTCGADFDTVVSVLDGCGGNELGCNDDACGLSSSVSVPVTNGQVILIRVAGYNADFGTGNLLVHLDGPPPPPDDLPATAQVPAGSGTLASLNGFLSEGDAADMFKVTICDYLSFFASTENPTTDGQDTQLFLFDEAGNGVQMNDDGASGQVGLNSEMAGEFVSANGTYYIAISHYDNDPLNASGAPIWEDTPFGAVRAPDGITNGGDIAPASWSTANVTAFAYEITLTGVCYFEDGGCEADFNGDTVLDFFDYLDFVSAFSDNDPSADFNADTIIDFFDYLDFVAAFSEGCP